MSNYATVTTYLSSTSKTTAVVTQMFTESNSPNYHAAKVIVDVTFAAETLINASGTAAALAIPVDSFAGNSFAFTEFNCHVLTALTQGGSATSTTLTPSIVTATTPSTVAITTASTVAGIGAKLCTDPPVIATTGTATNSANQFVSTQLTLTSTLTNIASPGQTVYLVFFPSGTLTSGTTYTGHYKFVFSGCSMTNSPSQI